MRLHKKGKMDRGTYLLRDGKRTKFRIKPRNSAFSSLFGGGHNGIKQQAVNSG